MKKVRFSKEVGLVREAGTFFSGIDYLLNDATVLFIEEDARTTGYKVIESCEEYPINNWKQGQAVKKLLVWNTGKIGDQLWTTALVRAIKKRNPRMRIDIVCEPGTKQIWTWNKDVGTLREEPIPIEGLKEYDGVLILEDLVSSRTDKDQPNCYQILFEAAGIPFTKEEAIPRVHLKRLDESSASQKTQKYVPTGEAFQAEMLHVILGLHSSSKCRNLSPEQWVEIAKQLRATLPKIEGEDVVVYGVSNDDGKIQDALVKANIPRYIPIDGYMNLRDLASLCRISMMVVGVDSMLVHLAAAVDAPCVAIMTTVPPEARTNTYPLCAAVWNESACSYAPCYWKYEEFHYKRGAELQIAPCYTPTRTQCDIARNIDMKELGRAFAVASNAKSRFDDYNFKNLPI